jgi:hypothetical protein
VGAEWAGDVYQRTVSTLVPDFFEKFSKKFRRREAALTLKGNFRRH